MRYIFLATLTGASRLPWLVESTRLSRGYAGKPLIDTMPDAISQAAGIFVTMAVRSKMEASQTFLCLLRPVIKVYSELVTAHRYSIDRVPLKKVKQVLKTFTEASITLVDQVVSTHKVLSLWSEVEVKFEKLREHMFQQVGVLTTSMEGFAKHQTEMRFIKARQALMKAFIYPLLEIASAYETTLIERCEPSPITREWAKFMERFLANEKALTDYVSVSASVLYKSFENMGKELKHPKSISSFKRCTFMEMFSFFAHEAAIRQSLPAVKLKVSVGTFPDDAQLLRKVPEIYRIALEASAKVDRATEALVTSVDRLWDRSLSAIEQTTASQGYNGMEDIKELRDVRDRLILEQLKLTQTITAACCKYL